MLDGFVYGEKMLILILLNGLVLLSMNDCDRILGCGNFFSAIELGCYRFDVQISKIGKEKNTEPGEINVGTY